MRRSTGKPPAPNPMPVAVEAHVTRGAAPQGEPPADIVGTRRALVPAGPTRPARRTARSWGVIRDSLELTARPLAAPTGASTGDSLSRAVRTHALCMHTQDRLGRRDRQASRRGTAAHRPQLVAHTLHTHAYAGLTRPREKAPRNSDLRHESQHETAGHSVVPTQTCAKNQTS